MCLVRSSWICNGLRRHRGQGRRCTTSHSRCESAHVSCGIGATRAQRRICPHLTHRGFQSPSEPASLCASPCRSNCANRHPLCETSVGSLYPQIVVKPSLTSKQLCEVNTAYFTSNRYLKMLFKGLAICIVEYGAWQSIIKEIVCKTCGTRVIMPSSSLNVPLVTHDVTPTRSITPK